MRPDFSEFSYGYAVTESLIRQSRWSISAAPLFPSLIQEGSEGGGYDVKIPFNGTPVFLQFKVSHCMVRRSAFEVTSGYLQPPFFRVHLRPTRHSQQHPMLLELEASGYAVYYVMPCFHTPQELNAAYLSDNILDRSLFINPSLIGALPDDRDHYLSFRNGYKVYFYSEPREIRESIVNDEVWLDLTERRGKFKPLRQNTNDLSRMATEMIDAIEKYSSDPSEFGRTERRRYEDRDPGSTISYIAHSFLDANIIQVGAGTGNKLGQSKGKNEGRAD